MAINEGFTLDSLDLNDDTNFVLEGLEFTPARKRIELVGSADSDGEIPSSEVHYTNAEFMLRVRVAQQSTMDLALAKLASLTDKLQKAERTEGGIPAVWTPANATKSATWYVISAELDGVPISINGDDAGWFVRMPVVPVRLICRPFGYGSAVTSSETTFATPNGTLTLSSIPGDVDAEGTLVLTDNVTSPGQARKHAEWGMEHAHYNAGSPFDLLLTSSELSIVGTQSVSIVDASSYSGNVIELKPLFELQQFVAKATGLPHRGTFRIKARVKATTDDEEVRLALWWRMGTSAYTKNIPVVAPTLSPADYAEIDLGTVNAPDGVGNLELAVLASSSSLTGGTEGVRLDYLMPVPTERYGIAAGDEFLTGGPSIDAYDDFNHDQGLALTGKTSASGDIWAGAGDADDFIIQSGSPSKVSRNPSNADASLSTGGRYVSFGASTVTTQTVVAGFAMATATGSGDEVHFGVLARFVDTGNYLYARIRNRYQAAGFVRKIGLYKRTAAGTLTVIKEAGGLGDLSASGIVISGVIAISVTSAGAITVATGSDPQTLETTKTVISTTDSVAAGAGALNDGAGGLYSAKNFSSSLFTVNVYQVVFLNGTWESVDTYAIPALGRAELSHDDALTYDAASGGNASPITSYRGARVFLPPGSSRFMVKARRDDIAQLAADTGITDSTKVKLAYTPRYLNAPR